MYRTHKAQQWFLDEIKLQNWGCGLCCDMPAVQYRTALCATGTGSWALLSQPVKLAGSQWLARQSLELTQAVLLSSSADAYSIHVLQPDHACYSVIRLPCMAHCTWQAAQAILEQSMQGLSSCQAGCFNPQRQEYFC